MELAQGSTFHVAVPSMHTHDNVANGDTTYTLNFMRESSAARAHVTCNHPLSMPCMTCSHPLNMFLV
jgi:hypothetical protein